jgi:outer membrane protein assembly factor BamA
MRAQTPSSSARCSSPSLPSDEKVELIGEKAFPKVVVDSVVFDGTTSLPSSIRGQLISELESKEISASSERLEEFNEIAVRGAWGDQGFFKMTSTVKAQTISSDATEQHVFVTIHVDEGIQYRLKGIRFRNEDDDWSGGNKDTGFSDETARKLAFPPDELRQRVPLSDGEIFSTTRIKEGLNAIHQLYSSHGYTNFVATPLTEVDDSSGMISLTMALDEGRQFRVRKIEVQGLDPQTEGRLKLQMKPGDIFNSDLVGDFFADNKNILPPGASPENAELHKNEKNGTVDVLFRFPTCP